ncbi:MULTISPECIES: DUF3077 domain-containing protein [Pseudomonas]|uniref:DUF3077 domain-containing protein n=1 Tax=Pseudomonas TaxID=286 RepID=UPI001BE562E9|nr:MULTISPECIES: DUF3077 domain-containing protein [Pseudomonas]MBT2339504.1 DUF3077 domain-containing protein [Pseudomonas fluorescens]MCD4528668.1 DUF3077 domain-containing protein [Pseudomonas sp. C3-2018]
MNKHTEVNEKLNAGASRAPVTAESSFASCNIERQDLFSVRPDVPAWDALSEASCILHSVKEVLVEAGMETIVISPNQAWLLYKAVESAKAVVDSVHEGLDKFV